MGPEEVNPAVEDLGAWDVGKELMEDVIEMDGVGVAVPLDEETVGDMLENRSFIFDVWAGATGCGAANGVAEVMVEVAGGGGGELRPVNPLRCASVTKPGVVAD